MQGTYILPAIVGLIVVRLLYGVYQTLTSPLFHVPGPWMARFTKMWYFNRVRKGHFESENIALHRKYGPIVRVGPNMYSIDDPAVVKSVYGIGSKFPKSTWYEGWKHPSPDRWTLFPDQDMKRHAETRKRFQAMYSMSSLVNFEGYVDECAGIFRTRLMEFAGADKPLDISHWFQCYAFDVIGDITYSKRFGFLDQGEDVNGLLAALQRSMMYSTLIGIYAWLHPWLFGILGRFKWSGAGARVTINSYVGERLEERKEERQDETKKVSAVEGAPQDFLEKLMLANEKDPEKVTPYHVYMMGLSNIVAGSDTTAVSLSGILYYLLKFPDTMEKLRAEVDQFEAEGKCGTPNVAFRESQAMPYLQAVIKEGLRMHSAVGLPLWRVVPHGGAEICGQFFPAGTEVGLNPWCAHYNGKVFTDPYVFRPERWVETEGNRQNRLEEMEAYYLPFGLGSRTCLGRHISILEISKLIPQIVRMFEFHLEDPNEAWDTKNFWFVKPTALHVRVRGR